MAGGRSRLNNRLGHNYGSAGKELRETAFVMFYKGSVIRRFHYVHCQCVGCYFMAACKLSST